MLTINCAIPKYFRMQSITCIWRLRVQPQAHRSREQVSLAFGLRLWQVIIQGANGAQSQTTDINNESLVNERVGCTIGAETRRTSQRSD